MRIQIIEDSKGKPTGVFIPMNDWKQLTKQYKDLDLSIDDEPTKKQLISEIKEAVQNLKLVRQGKMKARPAKDLLNEL